MTPAPAPTFELDDDDHDQGDELPRPPTPRELAAAYSGRVARWQRGGAWRGSVPDYGGNVRPRPEREGEP